SARTQFLTNAMPRPALTKNPLLRHGRNCTEPRKKLTRMRSVVVLLAVTSSISAPTSVRGLIDAPTFAVTLPVCRYVAGSSTQSSQLDRLDVQAPPTTTHARVGTGDKDGC